MTFFTDAQIAIDRSPFDTHEICLQCGQPSAGPTVAWDMHMPGDQMKRVLFHRDCAQAMSLGMLMDAYPNRGARGKDPAWP